MENGLHSKIERINEIKKEIRSLEYFTEHISATLPRHNAGLIVKTKTLVRLKIFGHVHFGCGSHDMEITVPNSLCADMHVLAENQLQNKYAELNSLIQ